MGGPKARSKEEACFPQGAHKAAGACDVRHPPRLAGKTGCGHALFPQRWGLRGACMFSEVVSHSCCPQCGRLLLLE
eukprot:scaffold205292_cov19-Tisochrysis_lutea.AAC.2